MKNSIGVHVGTSFIEISSQESSPEFQHQRIYFPKLGLKPSLKQLLQNTKLNSKTQILISLEYLEKILPTRLGGSVAQLVTRGFEDLLLIKEAAHQSSTHLGNPDLIFPIKERVLADGSIQTPLNMEDLEFIESKFSMMEIKKVVIHFSHAKVNPVHQNQVAEYFNSKGYEIYLPSKNAQVDESSRWHRNLLNASLKGTFDEVHKEISEVLAEIVGADFQSQQTHYLNAQGRLFQDSTQQISTNLLALYFNLNENAHSSLNTDVLYLGLEKFFFIPKDTHLSHKWNSSWGPLELEHPQLFVLPFNIASSFLVDDFNEIAIDKKLGSFDPGPLCFGRGLNFTLLDLWFDDLQESKIVGLSEHLKLNLSSKVKNSLMVLAKMAEKLSYSPSDFSDLLKNQVIEEIWIQIAPHLQKETFTIAGPLAPLLAEKFLSFSKKIKISNEDYWKSKIPTSGGEN